jgi:hypothetical protein
MRHCMRGLLGLVLCDSRHCRGLGAFAQTIHGRDGITLPPPPAVEAIPVTDDYFGTKITDNYRWLEDAKSTRRAPSSTPRTPTRRAI